jgi:type IV secretion system protein VirB8
MNEHSRKMLDTYYEQAAGWNSDRLKGLRSSQRLAWTVAFAAALVASLEAGAIMLMMPLKTVEPYTLLVDKTTGYVQPLRPLEPGKVAPDAALTQSYLVQYVIAREGFDFAAVSTNYRRVALFSEGVARNAYLAAMQPTNPDSPLVLYPRGTVIETRVKSVSPTGPDSAMVRFDTIRNDPNGHQQPARQWVALVRYRYSSAPMALEDRFVNPLGFQVVEYRRDPETLAPAPDQDPQYAPPPAAASPLAASAPAQTTTAAVPGQLIQPATAASVARINP